MQIKRDQYLKQLIEYQWDGQVKVITGIRRCGKSYLLRTLFKNYLLEHGVKKEQILSFELDLAKDIRFRNPLELSAYVREIVEPSAEQYYLFVDEIQMSDQVPNPIPSTYLLTSPRGDLQSANDSAVAMPNPNFPEANSVGWMPTMPFF